MRARRAWWLAVTCVLVAGSFAPSLQADDESNDAVFAQATHALKGGEAGSAIAFFEALADRGVVDPAVSYDRGLAYTSRIRIGAEVPGDLGRAAQGFEEARELTRDARLAEDASRSLAIVRSEVARRRMRAGQPVEIDPGRSLARTLAGLMGEDTWAYVAVASSLVLALGLFLRWAFEHRRVRVGGGVAAGVAAPALVLAIAMALAARRDRLELHEAVIVASNARPTDDRGIALAGATALPEASRVEIVESRGASSRIRFGTIEEWVPSDDLREIARP